MRTVGNVVNVNCIDPNVKASWPCVRGLQHVGRVNHSRKDAYDLLVPKVGNHQMAAMVRL